MPAVETLTWDIAAIDGGPRRPSLEDVGGATLQDDAMYPPDPTTMPYAAQLNQLQKQAAAVGEVVPALVFSVEFTAGDPIIVSASGPRTSLVIADLTPTDNGVGDTTITWPANTFPPEVAGPEVSINEDTGALTGGNVVAVTNGVRVRTYNAGGPLDLAFTVTRR